MSGQPLRKPQDAQDFFQDYLSVLNLQSNINEKNLEANRVYKSTGQLPPASQMPDSRSVEDKMKDIQGLKTSIIKALEPISSQAFGQTVVSEITKSPLNANNALLVFIAQRIAEVVEKLKGNYALGIKGDENDAIQMVKLYEDMYTKMKKGLYTTRAYFDRPVSTTPTQTVSDVVRQSGEVLQAYNVDIVQSLRKLGTRMSQYPDIVRYADEVGNKLATFTKLITAMKTDMDIRDKFIFGEWYEQSLDANWDKYVSTLNAFEDILRDVPNYETFKTMIGQIKSGFTRTSGFIDREFIINILRKLDEFIPSPQVMFAYKKQLDDSFFWTRTRVRVFEEDGMLQQIADSMGVQLATIAAALGYMGKTIYDKTLRQPVNYLLEEQPTRITRDILRPAAETVVNAITGGPTRAPEAVPTEALPQLPQGTMTASPDNTSLTSPAPYYTSLLDLYGPDYTSPQFSFGTVPPYTSERELPLPIYDIGSSDANQRIMADMMAGREPNMADVLEARQEARQPYTPIGFTPYSPYAPMVPPDFSFAQLGGFNAAIGRGMCGEKRGRGRPKGSVKPKIPFQAKIAVQEGIKSGPRFSPFGKYVIDKNNLMQDVITLKSMKGGNIIGYPNKKVSRKLGDVFRKMTGGMIPSFDDMASLDEEEKKYLHEVAKKSNLLDKISVPTPNKDERERDLHQFEVMKGEIMSGNDNKEFIKKFKILLMKLQKNNELPKREVNEILGDLAELGY